MTAVEDKIQAHPINETASEFLREAGQAPHPAETLPISELAYWVLSKATPPTRRWELRLHQEMLEFLELAWNNPFAAAMAFATDRVELVRAMQAAEEAGQDSWPLLEAELDQINDRLKEADDPEAAAHRLLGSLIDNLTLDWM